MRHWPSGELLRPIADVQGRYQPKVLEFDCVPVLVLDVGVSTYYSDMDRNLVT